MRLLPKSGSKFLADLEKRARLVSLMADEIADELFGGEANFDTMKVRRAALSALKETVDMDVAGMILAMERISKPLETIDKLNRHLCVLYAAHEGENRFVDCMIGRWGARTDSFFGEED